MLDILIPNKPESGLFGPHIAKLELALRWAEDNYKTVQFLKSAPMVRGLEE